MSYPYQRRYPLLDYWSNSTDNQQPPQPQLYHYDYSTTHHQHWPQDNTYPTAAAAVPFSDSYPESSQRTILTPPPNYSPSVTLPSPLYKNHHLPRSPSLSPDYCSNNSWGDVLDDSSVSSRHPSAPLAPSTPLVASTSFISTSPPSSSSSVKEEPDDGVSRFIMELSAPQVQSTYLSESLAPPTEVPLRATQAPPKMRSMMGVFRLNPFAMQTGEGRGMVSPTWCGEEARPLDEEPIIFEFQIDIEDDIAQIPEQPKEPLRPFSPDFELHQENDEHDQHEWQDESGYTSTTPPTWELDYPPSEDHFSSSEPVSTHLQARHHSSRLYECTSFSLCLYLPIYLPASSSVSQHYLHKNAEHADYTAACYPSSTPSMVSAINAHRMRPPEACWSQTRTGYNPASRSTIYASDSPVCHVSITSVSSMRHVVLTSRYFPTVRCSPIHYCDPPLVATRLELELSRPVLRLV
jgi:hypothetical protein